MILRVREIGDTSDDGAVWPVPSGDQDGWLVELEEWDGDRASMRWMSVTGVLEQEVLPGGAKTMNRLAKVNGFAYITDARLIVAVEKFDKGSTYVGFGGVGAAAGLAATGISKALAARRRKDKILVGHVRWQWVKAVAAQPGNRSGTIRMVYETKSGSQAHLYRLDLTVPGSAPALQVAKDCVQRAAAWRLAHFPGREDGRDKLLELASAPVLPVPDRGKLAVYSMPNYFYVNRGTAYPKPAEGEQVRPAEVAEDRQA
jgi:hypothetical protein